MQNGSFGLRDEWFQPRFQQADTVCRATAVPGEMYPKWHEPMRRDVARYVSETRSCAAHRFYCGVQQFWNRYKGQVLKASLFVPAVTGRGCIGSHGIGAGFAVGGQHGLGIIGA